MMLRNYIVTIFSILAFTVLATGQSEQNSSESNWAIVIHGGAGNFHFADIEEAKREAYLNKLSEAIEFGAKLLKEGGTSIDAVEGAIRMLEDSPLFNAGKGSVFTHEGAIEMDASIMNGENLNAGAVAGVSKIKNPISGARLIMEKSRHVMLSGQGADSYAALNKLALEDSSYFRTENRLKQLKDMLEKEGKMGTVGCVAFDKHGNLAAGTSTGGMTNKEYGRIGDSPIIGCGTYANNNTCGISFTGHGEFIIREVAAHNISALMEYGHLPLQEAMQIVILEKLQQLGGSAGAIGIDNNGQIHWAFNTTAMFRASMSNSSAKVVEVD
jgi:L-asparaginase / beta-aspartyl-peptidase